MKQRTERLLLKNIQALNMNKFYEKIQVNPYAHTKTNADYEIITEEKVYRIECKEVDLTKNKILPFVRLTQLESLYYYNNCLAITQGFFMILFYNKRYKNSDLFIIPVNHLKLFIECSSKKSINHKEALDKWDNYKYSMENSPYFNLGNIIK